jgi:hypothetical protein
MAKSEKIKTKKRKHIKADAANVSIYVGKLKNRISIQVRLTRSQERRLLVMLKKRDGKK